MFINFNLNLEQRCKTCTILIMKLGQKIMEYVEITNVMSIIIYKFIILI